jgi:hypothetical protein
VCEHVLSYQCTLADRVDLRRIKDPRARSEDYPSLEVLTRGSEEIDGISFTVALRSTRRSLCRADD